MRFRKNTISRCSSYKRKGERNEQKKSKLKRTSEEPTDSFLSSPENRQKRTKVSTPASPKEKPCVICNQMKCQGDAKRYWIRDLAPAKKLIKVANFNKDSVHTRIVYLKTTGDVFAEDIMHHNNCLNKYIKRFQRDVETLMEFEHEDQTDESQLKICFEEVIKDIDIVKQAYVLTDLRETLNKKMEGISKFFLNINLWQQ